MQSNFNQMENPSESNTQVAPDNFERIYFPTSGHGLEKIERIMQVAEQNGFVEDDKKIVNIPQKVKEIANGRRYIILQRCYQDLTLSTRSPRNCPPAKLGPKEKIIYNPEDVVDWVEKQRNFLASN
jgi:hypothetical protein